MAGIRKEFNEPMRICAGDDLGRECYSTAGWREMSDELYAAAAEVAGKLRQ